MNNRIQQLAEQASHQSPAGYPVTIPYSKDFAEKFAELIVQECIEQASIGNGHGNNQWDRALTFSAKNIKEHFGVEE